MKTKYPLTIALTLLASTTFGANLFSGTLTNFWSPAGNRVRYHAEGYNTATNAQLTVSLDTNTVFVSNPETGQGRAWNLDGVMEFDGTNLYTQTTFAPGDPAAPLESSFGTVTNFVPGLNVFALTATNAPSPAIWLVVSNAGSASFNGSYTTQPSPSPDGSTTVWWVNGMDYAKYVLDASTSNLWSLHTNTPDGVGYPTEYFFYAPTNPASGQSFSASIFYGDGVPGDSPAPTVFWFQPFTTNVDGFVLTGGAINSSIAIAPAITPMSLSFRPALRFQFPITAQLYYSAAHGLGRVPSMVVWSVICVTNDAATGYQVGDVIDNLPNGLIIQNGGGQRGTSSKTATTVTMGVAVPLNDGYNFALMPAVGGSQVQVTSSDDFLIRVDVLP